MSPTPEPDPLRLTLLYTFVFVEIGIAMPFMPVWLNALGLDPRVIGALIALPIVIRIVATAPLMSLIDRGVPAPALLIAGSLGGGLTYAAMPLAAGFGGAPLAGLVALNALCGASLVPCIDYLTLAAVRRSARLDYARIRMGGSVGFLAANLAGGALLGLLGERFAVPLLLTLLSLVAGAVALAVGETGSPARPASPGAEAPGPRLPNQLRLAIAAAATIQATHAAVNAFGAIHWAAHGIAPRWIGALWAIGVASEIVLFAIVRKVPARWRSPFRMIGLGAGAALVRAVGMAAFGTELPAALALQLLHGFTFGATQLGAMAAVSQLAPEGARGRAQGTVSAATALVASGSTLLCGLVYAQAGGAATFLSMAPLALTGLCLAARGGVLARRAALIAP